MPKTPADAGQARRKVALFLALAFGLSCIPYYLIATGSAIASQDALIGCLVWCPGVAAIITRLHFQKNLDGFGFGLGDARWLLAGISIPVALAMLMFGGVWLAGAAGPDSANAAKMLSPRFIIPFAFSALFSTLFALGEELGWRGLLVPEMSKFMDFTRVGLISGAIWAVWHFPVIIFGSYHGTGPLWLSLLAFTPYAISAGVILAWLRLKSGSIWVSVVFHGLWNYLVLDYVPALTVQTPASGILAGEFGLLAPLMFTALALVFWHCRGSLPQPNGKK